MVDGKPRNELKIESKLNLYFQTDALEKVVCYVLAYLFWGNQVFAIKYAFVLLWFYMGLYYEFSGYIYLYHYGYVTGLLTWFNLNPSMDK